VTTLFEHEKKPKKKPKPPYEWIESMCYSPGPDNWALAVGSHNNMIYILEIDKNYKQYGKTLTGHSSFITSMDWSQDDKWMRSTCGAHELLFWKPALATDKGKRSTGAR